MRACLLLAFAPIFAFGQSPALGSEAFFKQDAKTALH